MAQLAMVRTDGGINLDQIRDWRVDTIGEVPRLTVRLGGEGDVKAVFLDDQAVMLAAYLASRSIDVATWYAHFRESAAWDDLTPLQRAVARSM